MDANTTSKMMMPRSGVADITNGTNWMRSSKKKHHHRHGSFHTVSHYSFFQGNCKWPTSKYHLTYGFLLGTPTVAISPVTKAFETWAANTHFKFSRALDQTNADLKNGFHRGDHAFAPTNGRFHCDADEKWSVGAVPGSYDLETVALHWTPSWVRA